MPARFISLITDQYYHIFNRGVNKQPIFQGVRDYKRALDILEFYSYNTKLRYSKFLLLSQEDKSHFLNSLREKNDRLIEIICFCLMPNHFHLLLIQKKENGISKFMANLQNSYIRYFNTKHRRIGPLMQGQFKAVRVEDDDQLLHLSRYIHLNPFTSFVVKTFEDLERYQWSSLPEYLGKTSVLLCNKEIILSNFKNVESYKQFVYNQADYQRELDRIKHLTWE